MDWKLQRYEVEKLIYLYKQNKCLWDHRSTEYKRNDLKREAWQNLAAIFRQDIDTIKRKMKHLRSAYVSEKKKCDEYLGVQPAYKPNLFYYDDMSFLDPIIVLRKQPTLEKIEKFESADVSQDYTEYTMDERISDEHTIEEDAVPQPLSPPPQSSKMSESPVHTFKAKRQKLAPYYSKLNTAVNTLADATKSTEDSIYMTFGKTIALQLGQLSPLDATIAMAEIHKVLSTNVIKSMLAKSKGSSSSNIGPRVSTDDHPKLSISALIEHIENDDLEEDD